MSCDTLHNFGCKIHVMSGCLPSLLLTRDNDSTCSVFDKTAPRRRFSDGPLVSSSVMSSSYGPVSSKQAHVVVIQDFLSLLHLALTESLFVTITIRSFKPLPKTESITPWI